MASMMIAVPLLAVMLLNLLPARASTRPAFWVALLLCAVESALALLTPTASWSGAAAQQLDALIGLSSQAAIGDLGRVLYLTIGLVGATCLMVARATIAAPRELALLANLVLLATAGMNGIVVARDLFTLYVFIEVAAVSSFVLIALERRRAALEGAFKYILLSAVATALMLCAIGLALMASGSTSFGAVRTAFVAAQAAPGTPQALLSMAAAVLFLGGVMIKSGLMPFHGWLPDAYTAAPAPVSVLLAGIVTKTSGVYALILAATQVFACEPCAALLLVVGTLSAVLGAFAALGQSNFKRMLAYSSISQVGYIVLGVAAGSALGLAGAALHLFNHAVFKTLLFVNAATVERQAGTLQLDELGGLAERMPVTGATSVVGLLSTAGVPPLSGFWSKLLIVVALWKVGHPAYAATAVLASLLTLGYFLVLQRRVFFGKLAAGLEAVREGNAWLLVPAVLLALITGLVGLLFPLLFETFLVPIGSILR